jgi:hypothetical protein
MQYVPSVPNNDFVAVVEGPVNFVTEGAYKFCINSDDGYLMILYLFQVVRAESSSEKVADVH